MSPGISLEPDRVNVIRRLGSSRFNYWFGYVANLALVSWMVSHAFPRRGHLRMGAVEFLVLAMTGLFSWTLSEFLLHRYLYHHFPSFLSVGHDLHHQQPRQLIGVPWYLTTVAVIAIFKGITLFLPADTTGVIMGSNWLGYVFYCIAHHGSHHWKFRNEWFRRVQHHHLIHHAHPEYNWGFTTSLWDHIFGTHYDRRSGATRASTT
jgi:sterol desaturase/sphingolipid hydroxylase (fatty acid hydroxylase superfamily)